MRHALASGFLASICVSLFSWSVLAEDKPAPATRPAGVDASFVEVPIKFPKPLQIVTPKNLKGYEHITQRPTFFAPPGTTNLAFRRPVTSSDDMPVIGDLKLVTDGDKYADDGYFVELGPGQQWLQIDLGKSAEIHAVLVWHFHAEARVYQDVIVQLSDDPKFAKDVVTVFNNDKDNSAKFGVGQDREYIETYLGKLISVKAHRARYVRLYSAGNTSNDQNHYIEVDVYGK